MDFDVGTHPRLFITIGGGEDVGHLMQKFEWKSFTNGGYIIRAKLYDTGFNQLKDIATRFYLDKGMKEPTKVEFRCYWPGVTGENADTGKHLAYMTELEAIGRLNSGFLEFVAVDPPSYLLNQGGSSGKVYKGKVSDVIKKVVQDYAPGIDVKVSDTTDYDQNLWHMNRMDPKTFISSLLDWSSSVTQKKTNWIVSSSGADGNLVIWIKEQADRESKNFGTLAYNRKTPGGNSVYNFDFLADTFIAIFQKQVITQGMSVVSEKYWDRIVDDQRKVAHVYDEVTEEKKNVDIDAKKGFAKPGGDEAPEKPHEWSTSILSVPEHSAGDVGKRYDEYIDGRARGTFMNMLNLTMRCKFRTTGIGKKELANSHFLGVSKIKVLWRDADNNPYVLDGDWLIYGFHHIMTVGHWFTDLYGARLPFNASAQKV